MNTILISFITTTIIILIIHLYILWYYDTEQFKNFLDTHSKLTKVFNNPFNYKIKDIEDYINLDEMNGYNIEKNKYNISDEMLKKKWLTRIDKDFQSRNNIKSPFKYSNLEWTIRGQNNYE